MQRWKSAKLLTDHGHPKDKYEHQKPRKGQASSADALQLRSVTSTEPDYNEDPHTRKLVRSHVVRGHHATRREEWEKKETLSKGALAPPCKFVGDVDKAAQVRGSGVLPNPTAICLTCGGQQV